MCFTWCPTWCPPLTIPKPSSRDSWVYPSVQPLFSTKILFFCGRVCVCGGGKVVLTRENKNSQEGPWDGRSLGPWYSCPWYYWSDRVALKQINKTVSNSADSRAESLNPSLPPVPGGPISQGTWRRISVRQNGQLQDGSQQQTEGCSPGLQQPSSLCRLLADLPHNNTTLHFIHVKFLGFIYHI